MKRILIILLACVIPLLVLADGSDELVKKGNEFYAAGNYPAAIDSYEQVLKSGQESLVVYYNLGNAYFKINELASAILYFERGLLLSPGDADIAYNLSIANGLITDRIEELPQFFMANGYNSFKRIFSTNQWAVFSLLSFVLMTLLIISFFILKSGALRRLALTFSIILLILSSLSLLFSVQQANNIKNRDTCIVFAQSVTIKSAPDDSGTDLFVLHEGVKLQVKDRVSGWIEIQMADGNVGWIPEEAIVTI